MTNTWKNVLSAAVAAKWQTGQCFLIAQVKPLLTTHGFEVEALLEGRQMRIFLESEAPELRQIVNEEQPTNWGLVPPEATPERPHAQYFGSKTRRSTSSTTFPYQNALRTAFGRSLEDGLRRFVLHSPVRFVDLPNGAPNPDGVEVTRDDLAVGADDTTIVTHVTTWIGRNGLTAADYQPSRSSFMRSAKPQATALHDLIDMIEPADLDRIALPLDIVRKMLAKPGHSSR
ncbi:hypothetical protein [Sphingobium cupriresistens]|uniref:Uncharacterized protein n=1 Tax=Sphingobium cupriresistens TaxID=1132417 RepID=A0A8G1ZEN2_9SPHN|nr:hypothetical protein [Sphingobium cupriresistens]RYM07423.1 hypothetical protein EWH12_19045 [Sphingobium cupriresistens]